MSVTLLVSHLNTISVHAYGIQGGGEGDRERREELGEKRKRGRGEEGKEEKGREREEFKDNGFIE